MGRVEEIIERLAAERAELRGEVERLRGAAEQGEKLRGEHQRVLRDLGLAAEGHGPLAPIMHRVYGPPPEPEPPEELTEEEVRLSALNSLSEGEWGQPVGLEEAPADPVARAVAASTERALRGEATRRRPAPQPPPPLPAADIPVLRLEE